MTPPYAATPPLQPPKSPLTHLFIDDDDEGLFVFRVLVPGGHAPSGGRRLVGRGCLVDCSPASVEC